jgi:hypothetical protein
MGPPDLAVEGLSPGDRPGSVADKILYYLLNGVRLVWLIDPDRRIMQVFTPDCVMRDLTEDDTLDGGDVLPGFAVAVRDILPPARGPVVVTRGVGDGRFGRVPPVSDPAAPCPARTGPSASRCGSLKSGRDARAPRGRPPRRGALCSFLAGREDPVRNRVQEILAQYTA